MINFLKIFLSLVLIFMIYMVISTSLQSNLIKEWDFLATIPWMRATLWDFYANILIIYLWILYKEKSYSLKGLWLLMLFCLGSIASLAYVLIQLFQLKQGESFKKILLRSEDQ